MGCDVDWVDVNFTNEPWSAEDSCANTNCDTMCGYNQAPEYFNGVTCEEQYTGHGSPDCGSPVDHGGGMWTVDGVCTCGW